MTGQAFRAERLEADRLGELKAALEAAALPVADIGQPGRRFFRFGVDGETAGFAGLEGQGTDLLLRSLVVLPAQRGQGLGSRVIQWVEEEATARGGRRLHLLTNTAAPFFTARGYADTDRIEAPPAIRDSAEFSRLCPASARYLVKRLSA